MRKRDLCTHDKMMAARGHVLRTLEKEPRVTASEHTAGFLAHPDGSVTQITVKAYRRDSKGLALPGQDDYLPPLKSKRANG